MKWAKSFWPFGSSPSPEVDDPPIHSERPDGATEDNGTKESTLRGLSQKYPEVPTKFAGTLRFVALSEETKSTPQCFCKSYPKESSGDDDMTDATYDNHTIVEEDWKDNHFLRNDKKSAKKKDVGEKNDDKGGYGVMLTSYDLDVLRKKLLPVSTTSAKCKPPFSVYNGNEKKTEESSQPSTPCWLRFDPLLSHKLPKIPSAGDSQIRTYLEGYLEHLQKHNPQEFQHYNVDGVVTWLKPEDMDDAGVGEVRDFIGSALNNSVAQKLAPLYKKLFKWHARLNPDVAELVLGFGHVRMVYTTKSKPEPKIVNGPLFEVLVDVKLQGAESAIAVCPRKDARLRVNREVISALVDGGGGNEVIVNKLYQMAEEKDAMSLALGNPDTYNDFLAEAKNLCWNGAIKSTDDQDVHDPPADPNALVVTDAWCLSSRKKISTVYSRDAHRLAEAVDSGKLKFGEPIYALMEGPHVLEETGHSKSASKHQSDHLVYSLPASKAQKQIGHQLFVEHRPVVIVDGPPGTGKTHSIVNAVAAALSKGLNILYISSNSRALAAFIEKLPPKLRVLCASMSTCEEGGIMTFHKNLEEMTKEVTSAKNREEEKEIEIYQQQIKDKKAQRSTIDKEIASDSKAKRRLIERPDVLRFFELALEVGQKMPWIVTSILMEKSDILDQLGKYAREEATETVSLGDINVGIDTIIDLVAQQEKEEASLSGKAADEDMRGNPNIVPQFKFGAASQEHNHVLSKLKVNGRSPTSREDWGLVLDSLRRIAFRNTYIQPLLKLSYREEDVFDQYSKATQGELQKGKDLSDMFNTLEEAARDALRKLFKDSPDCRAFQDQRQKLTADIQDLETELVFKMVIVALKKSLSQKHLSKLIEFTQMVGKASSNFLGSSSGSGSEKTLRLRDEFKMAMAETAEFMPFLVMTTEQASALLSPDHVFDLGIIDEASQSDCTALLALARCKQILSVGDDKQVSPTDCFVKEERAGELRVSLPNIPSAQKLLPGSSIFELFKVAFPSCSIFLDEHFRCVPEITNCFNDIFYHSRLDPTRPSKERALEDIRLDGERDKKAKTNEVECYWIVQQVCAIIRKTVVKKVAPQTIGIGSMGGQEQCKLLENILEEKLDPLLLEYGSEIVERHKILIGVPSEFQGAERDIVFLSTVYGGKGQTLRPEIDPASRKKWNVALSRAKNKMVLVRSFDLKDIKNPNDIRRSVFRCFLGANKSSESIGVQAMPRGSAVSSPIQAQVESMLISSLTRRGFYVTQKKGKSWSKALCIGRRQGEDIALLCIENAGESKEARDKTLDQQLSLERARRACLRVDFFSLVVNFSVTLDDVLSFLAKAGQSEPPVQVLDLGVHKVSDRSDSETSESDASLSAELKRPPITSPAIATKRNKSATDSLGVAKDRKKSATGSKAVAKRSPPTKSTTTATKLTKNPPTGSTKAVKPKPAKRKQSETKAKSSSSAGVPKKKARQEEGTTAEEAQAATDDNV